jgi:hypothetical protein
MNDQVNSASLFDPDNFLDTSTDQALSTKPILHPVGSYLAMIGTEIKARKFSNEKGTMAFLDLPLEIDGNQPIDDGTGRMLKEVTGRDKTTVTDSVILDLNESGHMDLREGRNFRIGRYRAAVDQNHAGQTWKPRDLAGQMVKVTVGHRPDKNDPDKVYVQINGVEKA